MACIRADGTLTSWAQAMLAALQEPKSHKELAAALRLPELADADLVEAEDAGFVLTEHGREVVAISQA